MTCPTRPRLAAPDALRLLLPALALTALAAPPGSVAADPPATLPDPHIGTLQAPAVPLVNGAPAQTAEYRWERCRRYGTLVTADGARNRWPLGGTGATAADATGGATGTWTGLHDPAADGPLAGDPSTGTTFDGTATVLTVPAVTAPFTGTAAHTVEAWVRPARHDTRYRYLWSRQTADAAGRQGTGVWIRQTGIGFERFRDGAQARVAVERPLTPGVWHHVVASYDGTAMRLWVDGELYGTTATTLALLDAGTFQLGGRGAYGYLAGDLDEVAVYDRAIAPRQVATHLAAARTVPCTVIGGATSAAYAPGPDDLGSTIRVTTTGRRTAAPAGDATTVAESTRPADENGHLLRVRLASPAQAATVSGTVTVRADIAGLTWDRVEFVVDGVVRTRRTDAPFTYAWPTGAEANGTHVVAVRAYGFGDRTPATAQAAVTVQNNTVHSAPLPLGKESVFADINEGDVPVADNLLDDVWPARGFPLVNLGWPLTWTEDPYRDTYWRFYHYGLRPLGDLLYAWQTTGDARYRDKLVAILASYTGYDAARPFNRLTHDNNHASAFRAMTLVNCYFKLQRAGALPDGLRVAMEASIARLGVFLNDPTHYEGGVNLGFNEAGALLMVAENFPAMQGAATWRATAVQRLKELLGTAVDADGVEVENSPYYHVYVLGLVNQIAEWAKRYEPALAADYAAAAQRMLRHAAYVTQPNGYLPMLGATATTYLPSQDPAVYRPLADADPEFSFAYTRGRGGTPPPDGTYLFPASGLFVMRSPMGSVANLPNQTFVTFDAGPYRTEHSDLDALGVTMYSNGATVLPEAGLFTFEQQPERGYFHGTRAHNTVVVDGRDQAKGAAVPGPYGTANGASWATGTSRRYSGVTHRRAVAVLRQGLVLVIDRLAATASHDYAQTWHLPPGTRTETFGADILVTDAATGKRTLAIRQSEPAGMAVRTVTGQTSPVLQGWYSAVYGAKVASPALEFTRTAPAARFATLLASGPYAGQDARVTVAAVTGGLRADVCVGGAIGYAVVFPDSQTAQPTVTQGACATG
ncbi:MAG: heparinase II/III family protein [Thermoleophilia bacterium]|nr:heparinase II/III family protein [Thermoleophilia bacterium]